MRPDPLFDSLIVSRPRSGARLLPRVRGLALATVLYAGALGCLLVASLLLIEMVAPPRAEVSITFRPPGPKGDNLPAGTVRQGVRNGSENPAPAKDVKRAPDRRSSPPTTIPVAPPESEIPDASQGVSGSDGPGEGPGEGQPGGTGTNPVGPTIGCDDCPGTGTGTDVEKIYEQQTVGLIPPQIIPSSRALPKYPDLPRKAGLEGTVILLIVVEKDGTVGQIEVVRSPDQRWGFDLAAIDAVKQWRYQPALLDGRPVAAYINVMVEYSLSR